MAFYEMTNYVIVILLFIPWVLSLCEVILNGNMYYVAVNVLYVVGLVLKEKYEIVVKLKDDFKENGYDQLNKSSSLNDDGCLLPSQHFSQGDGQMWLLNLNDVSASTNRHSSKIKSLTTIKKSEYDLETVHVEFGLTTLEGELLVHEPVTCNLSLLKNTDRYELSEEEPMDTEDGINYDEEDPLPNCPEWVAKALLPLTCDFNVESCFDSGTFGSICKLVNRNNLQEVAAKVVKTSTVGKHEIQHWSILDDPNILPLLQVSCDCI